MQKNVDITLAACVLHNWCIMANGTNCDQFADIDITLDAHMNMSATVMGFPNSTSGNAKRNLLVDKINKRRPRRD